MLKRRWKEIAGVLAVGSLVGISIFAVSRTGADPVSNPLVSFGTKTCTTSTTGYCSGIPHGLNVVPTSVTATGKAPITGSSIPAQILTDSFTTTSFRVRAFNISGVALNAKIITFSWHADAIPVPTPTSTDSTTPTPTPTDSTSIPPSTNTTTPPVGAFPDSTNTGYRNAPNCPNGLTTYNGATVVSNTTYSCMDFPGGIDVGSNSVQVTNVTFYGSRFHGVAVNEKLVGLWGDNITFDYCSFEPGVAAPPTPFNQSYQYGIEADGSYNTHVGKLTVSHGDFWGFGNAIDIDGSTQSKPQQFTDNWIHDSAADGGQYHTDGIGSLSGSARGSYILLNHNTIESLGNTNGVAFQQGTYDHVTITNNLLGGFGYSLAVWATNTYTTVTDNTFSTRLPVTFGPLYQDNLATTTGSLWRRNHWRVPVGSAWGSPAHDGWFWIPVSADSPFNDVPFVSQTDFVG